MSELARWENQGFRFRLDGNHLFVRRYGNPIDKDTLRSIDKQAVINALHDRAMGFKPVEEQQLLVHSSDLPAYCTIIKSALDDGRLWNARAVYHKKSMLITFYLMPPGVIE